MTTNNTPISFTKNQDSGTVHTIPASHYEQLCKTQKNCFEIIPDEGYIKPYFDVDYAVKDGDGMDCEEVRIKKSCTFLNKILYHLWNYFCTNTQITPEFSIAGSHKATKLSFHINITNINTTKESILGYIQDINEQVKHYEGLTDDEYKPLRINTELQFGSDENLFDINVYKKKGKQQKMRSVHCVKDDEPERPIKILPKVLFDEMYNTEEIQEHFSICDFSVRDSFEDMLISVTNPDNEVYAPIAQTKPVPTPTPKSNKVSTAKHSDTTSDEMLANMAMDRGLMTKYSKKGEYNEWTKIGWIFKNTFEDEKGWELFDKFSRLAGNDYGEIDYLNNRETWDKFKQKHEHNNPIGMGSLIQMLDKDNKKEFKEIQKEIKSLKKTTDKKQIQNELENTFNTMAKEFEKTHCKIINKSIYIKELSNTVIPMSKSKMEEAYEHMSVGSNDKGVPTIFIKKWMKGNDNIRKFDDTDIYPNSAHCPAHIYNMWRPFKAELMTGGYKKNKKALNTILNHIRILCNNEEHVYDYLIKWIAQMIQYPEVKTIIPTLISKQGAGKGSLIKLFTKMMGDEKVLETTEPSRDVWGQFNGMMVNCFLVNLNELSKRETIESEGQIKGLVTDPTLSISSKFVNQYKIRSYHRFFITTNQEEGGIRTSNDDRRNLIIRASDELINNKEYFSTLHEYLEDEAVIRTCYDYFKQIPKMDTFGNLPIPQTEYQTQLKKLTLSPVELFLEDLVLKNQYQSRLETTGKELYYLFVAFVADNNIKFDTTPQKLGIKLTNMRIEGIQKGPHKDNGDTKIFDIPILKKRFNIGCMVQYDEDGTDEEN